jgi:hypothetical protein
MKFTSNQAGPQSSPTRNPVICLPARKTWLEHGLVFLFFSLLCIALTWPLLKDFSTKINGIGDATQLLWLLWHYRNVFFAGEDLFHSSLLYYPYGASAITTALYPLVGLLALPFWPIGPQAAYNGALLLGFILSGYLNYLLARFLKFDPGVALLSGVILLAAPIHSSALYGHLSKAFITIPIALIALNAMLDVQRSRWWSVATGFGILTVLLTSSEQVVFLLFAVLFFPAIRLIWANQAERQERLLRLGLASLVTMALISWYIILVYQALQDPSISDNLSAEAYQHQPDLIQFFIPGIFNRFLGPLFSTLNQTYTISPIETSVFLGWTALALSLVGWFKAGREARIWGLFLLLCALFALGPELKIFAINYIDLPFKAFGYLPALQAIRTPGRIMLIGFVALGIMAGYGLTWLQRQRSHSFKWITSGLAISLVVFEFWPTPSEQTILRPVPDFYNQISQDPDTYGVFDLPLRPKREISHYSAYYIYSSHYQWYQMTHLKGIASGYIGRPYERHPVFGAFVSNSVNGSPWLNHVLVKGQPANRYANARYELARAGYRYVVVHKPQPVYPDYPPGAWGERAAQEFITAVFTEETPFYEDELVTVFSVGPVLPDDGLTTTIIPLATNWESWVEFTIEEQWSSLPAFFYVASPQPMRAVIEFTLDAVIDNCTETQLAKAYFQVSPSTQAPFSEWKPGLPLRFTINLSAGSQVISIDQYGKTQKTPDTSCLTIKIKQIEMHTP